MSSSSGGLYILTADFWKGFYTDTTEFLTDLPIKAFKGITDAIVSVFGTITPPDFLASYHLADVLGPVMPMIGYFLHESGFGLAMSLISSAVSFRITRKIVTFGLW